jgi:hypothetical protein
MFSMTTYDFFCGPAGFFNDAAGVYGDMVTAINFFYDTADFFRDR